MKPCTLIVTMAFGLEKVVKQELMDLGFNAFTILDGRIEFKATFEDIPRLNLWLRAADRVQLKLAEFGAVDFDQLYDGASEITWDDWIPKNATITVVGALNRSTIDSIRVCQSMVKKAIVEQLKVSQNTDWLEETGPEYSIKISIVKDIAQITLDTSGMGLHKRGYRQEQGEAPMRENLAAALVLLSFWTKDRVLVDPLCGSGTIVIEAAMIARNMAPGLNRGFASEDWACIPKESWDQARQDAQDKIDTETKLQIFAYDSEKQRVEDGKVNANNAGVFEDIVFAQGDAKQLKLEHDHGIIITNPPYGMKVGSELSIELLYKSLNNILKDRPDWSLYIITADKRFMDYFTRAKPNRTRKLYNGTIEAHYFQYHGTRPHNTQ